MCSIDNKISIIVPVYNVEKYLNECIDSILNQTYKNFELIIVNDGSTDSSGNICDDYESKHENIKVIHKKNDGVASSRNIGLDFVTGNYVLFIDSDDWIEENTLEILNKTIHENDCDMIIYGFNMDFYEEKFRSVKIFSSDITYKSKGAYLGEFGKYRSNGMFGYVWNKLYKADIIINNKLEFEKNIFPEDLYFNFEILHYVNNIKVIDNTFYHYIHRSRETLSKMKRDRLAHTNKVYDRTVAFLKENDKYEVNEVYLKTSYLQNIMSYILNELSFSKNVKLQLVKIYSDYRVKEALNGFKSNIKFFRVMYFFMKNNMVQSTVLLLNIYKIYNNIGKSDLKQ